jgi:hypothetical protein
LATFEYAFDNALTWPFAGLTLIALVAGCLRSLLAREDGLRDRPKMPERIEPSDFVLAWAGAIVIVLFVTLAIEALR